MILPEWKKALILVVGLLEILIFSGTILGWTSLKLMLKNEKIYEYQCIPLSNETLASSSSASASSAASSNPRSLLNIQFTTTTPIPPTINGSSSTSRIPPFLASIPRRMPMIVNGTQLEITTTISPIDNDDDQVEEESQNRLARKQPTPPLLSQVSLKLDLTVSAVGNTTLQNNGQQVKTIVIPFEANQSLDTNLIYELVNSNAGVRISPNIDPSSSIALSQMSPSSNSTRNTRNNMTAISRTSAALSATSLLSEIRLFPRFVHPVDGRNLSTLEELLHFYMQETLGSSEHLLEDRCKPQETTLNFAFTIGSFCMGAAAFVWGFLLEKWGLRIVRLVINSMITIGAFLMCFTAPGQDWILFPAIFIMSLGGVPIRIANMQFSNLYPSKRSTIIAVYSGAFSASSIIYVLIEYIYREAEMSFFWAHMILVVFSLLMIPFTLFILPADKIHEQHTGKASSEAKEKTSKSMIASVGANSGGGGAAAADPLDQNGNPQSGLQFDVNSKIITGSQAVFAAQNITLQNYKEVKSPNMERKNNAGGFDNAAYIKDDEESGQSMPETDFQKPLPIVDGKELSLVAASAPPLSVSLYSIPYNLHQMWFSWMITYMLIYVGSMNQWTRRVTEDATKQGELLKLYGSVQVLALVISPLAGLLMDYKLARANQVIDPMKRKIKRIQSGFWPLLITTITLLICVLCQYFDRPEFVYISIIFITIYRAFLLAVGSAFLRIRFHGDHFNRLLGIMSSVSAFASLIQFPFYTWDTVYGNIFSTVISIIVLCNPLYLLITPLQKYFIRQEEAAMKKAT